MAQELQERSVTENNKDVEKLFEEMVGKIPTNCATNGQCRKHLLAIVKGVNGDIDACQNGRGIACTAAITVGETFRGDYSDVMPPLVSRIEAVRIYTTELRKSSGKPRYMRVVESLFGRCSGMFKGDKGHVETMKTCGTITATLEVIAKLGIHQRLEVDGPIMIAAKRRSGGECVLELEIAIPSENCNCQ